MVVRCYNHGGQSPDPGHTLIFHKLVCKLHAYPKLTQSGRKNLHTMFREMEKHLKTTILYFD